MTETEILIKYIGKIPELVESVDQYREINDKTIKTLAEAMKQHPQAIIPVSELMKISQYVAQTQCRLPDTDDLVNAIAKKMETAIVPLVRDEMRRAFGITEYTVKHEHAHTTLKDLKEVVDNRTRKLIRWLIVMNVILVLIIVVVLCFPEVLELIHLG